MNQTNISAGKLQNQINTVWLSFKDPKEQLEYSEREFKYDSRMIMHFLLFAFFGTIIMIIAQIAFGGDLMKKNLMQNVGLGVGFFAGFAIIRWPCKKQIIHYSKLIFVLLFSILMIVYEIAIQITLNSSENVSQPFHYYDIFQVSISFLILQFGIDLITLFSWKWYFSFLLHIGHFVFLLQYPLRWNCIGNVECQTIKFSSILRLFILFSWVLFLDQANMRMKVSYFNDVFQNKSQLDQFKTFLKELVPVPIIIGNFKKELASNIQHKFEIKFVNDPTMKLFGTEITSIEEELWKIQPDHSDFNSKLAGKQEESPTRAIICSFTDSLYILDGLKNKFENLKLNQFYTSQCKYEKELGENKIKIYYFEIKIAKIKWEGNEELAFCFHDIGIYKEFDEFKNKLLANVSHNLRTPINTINANLEMAQELEKSKQIKKLLKFAKSGCFLLINSVNDLLDYSQQCSGSLKINKKWFPLTDVVNEINKVAKLQAKQKDLSQFFDSKIDLGLFIQNDPDRLKQILLNILNNAVKFTTSGYIKFLIDKDQNDLLNSTRKIKFIVKDSGIGISKEHLNDLFFLYQRERIKQADSHFNIQGVGLGLNISNVLLKLIENTQENILNVESEETKGTRISFSVGINDQKEQVQSNSPQIEEGIIGNLPREDAKLFDLENEKRWIDQKSNEKLVLAVDDEPFCLDVVKKLLFSQGIHQIFTAKNGKEAIDIVLESAKKPMFFDLIIMDCDMPVMDGFEATKIIREMIADKKIRSLEIVALTANIATADEKTCKNAGMLYHLKKPVSKGDFFGTLSRIFNKVL